MNTSENILTISPGSQGLNPSELKERVDRGKPLAYYNYMVEVAVYLGANRTQAKRELRRVVRFEKTLSEIASQNGPVNDNLTLNTIEDLEEQLPYISWLQFLNNITHPVVTVKRDQKIMVRNPYFLQMLPEVLNKVSKRTLANYMIWRTIFESIPELHDGIQEKYWNFKKEYSENDKVDSTPRWQKCINQLTRVEEDGLTVAVGTLYVRTSVHPLMKSDISRIVQAIVDQFDSLFQKATWMDSSTKEQAILKLKHIRKIIAYPDELLNDAMVEEYVSNLIIDPFNHFENFLSKQRFLFDYDLSGLHESPTGNRLWTLYSNAMQANAFYSSKGNVIAIMAGMLQPPLYNPAWPDYAKFASLGVIVAHEIAHAFDKLGMQTDETGSIKMWFSNESLTVYNRKQNCYSIQYQQYINEFLKDNVFPNQRGQDTVRENMADNIGLKVAYLAYKKWQSEHTPAQSLEDLPYTPEQLFWIISTNHVCNQESLLKHIQGLLSEDHLPGDLRVRGMMSNSREFANDFHCSGNSLMNPNKKCAFFN